MAEIYWDEEAEEAITALERDSSRVELLRKVNEYLALLEADPGARRLRRHRFADPPVWYISIYTNPDEDDWALLWNEHPRSPGDVQVQYLGPASF